MAGLAEFRMRAGDNGRQELGDIVDVGGADGGGDRDAVAIEHQVVFRAIFGSIGGVGSGIVPPKTARTLEESTTHRDQSSVPACSSFWSRTPWILAQRPAACQSRSRRQHEMPEPHPISVDRSSHGSPVLSTNRIPVNAWRFEIGGRPPCGPRGRIGGNSGSITAHNSSGKNGFAMTRVLRHDAVIPSTCHVRKYC